MERHFTEALPFLGSRRYLQGTTLFDCLYTYIPPEASFSFKVPRVIRTPRVHIALTQEVESAPSRWDAVLHWKTPDQEGAVYATGAPSEADPVRIPFDESTLVGLAHFSQDSVKFTGASTFGFVTTIVSLNKACLLRSGKTFGQGQWAFMRLDLNRLPRSPNSIRLQVDSRVATRHATRTQVWVDGACLGDLYFAWVEF